MKIRLQKFLSQAGVASRRKAEGLIVSGKVTVNGHVITELGTKIEPEHDTVTLDGQLIQAIATPIYIMLHKPEGVVTTVSDPYNRPVVMDYIRETPGRLFPVGRLDYDSSGLLLITNDGEMAQILTHPRHKVAKTYSAKLRGTPSREGLRIFRKGLHIDGIKTAPAEIEILRKTADSTIVRITIREGRNRQIRKMCESIGCQVMQLKRVAIGDVRLGRLLRGQYRHLTKAEIRQLKLLCKSKMQ